MLSSRLARKGTLVARPNQVRKPSVGEEKPVTVGTRFRYNRLPASQQSPLVVGDDDWRRIGWDERNISEVRRQGWNGYVSC